MLAPSRLPSFVCVLVAIAFLIGCAAKVEVTTTGTDPAPGPGVILAPTDPKAGEPKEGETDKATPLEFKSPTGEDWSGVAAGEHVRLIGSCLGTKKGRIEFAGAGRYYGTRPAVPAADVSHAFTTDATAANDKYKDRVFVVEGVCVSINRDTLKVSGAKKATVLPSADPRLKDAQAAKAEATFTPEEFTAGKANTHKGKVIEVTGPIHSFAVGAGKGPVVGLGVVGTDAKIKSGQVQCRMVEAEPWDRLGYWQMVTIRGKCDFSGPYGEMSACVVVTEGASPLIKVSAKELAAEYKKDKKATDAKYYAKETGQALGKPLLITGEVLGWKRDKSGNALQLKGADGVTISCYLAPGATLFPEFEAPAGAKIELLAQYAFFGTENTLWTNMGVIRTRK
jgi:hypothetical protein